MRRFQFSNEFSFTLKDTKLCFECVAHWEDQGIRKKKKKRKPHEASIFSSRPAFPASWICRLNLCFFLNLLYCFLCCACFPALWRKLRFESHPVLHHPSTHSSPRQERCRPLYANFISPRRLRCRLCRNHSVAPDAGFGYVVTHATPMRRILIRRESVEWIVKQEKKRKERKNQPLLFC